MLRRAIVSAKRKRGNDLRTSLTLRSYDHWLPRAAYSRAPFAPATNERFFTATAASFRPGISQPVKYPADAIVRPDLSSREESRASNIPP